jgi:hypothetical protein
MEKNMSKYSIKRPYCEGSKASHKRSSNFLKKIKRERKRKKKEVTVYNQQAWRRYNHVKTQWWSLCGLPIHAFSMFNGILESF